MNLADKTISLFAGNGTSSAAEGDGFLAVDTAISALGGLAIDGAGNVYFTTRNTVRKVSALTGRISTLAGRADWGSSGDGGPALNAQFFPNVLAVDPAGNVHVDGRSTVRQLLPNTHDVPVTADMDGDARADLVVWRPGTGTWYWLTSSSGYGYGAARSLQWGSGALGDEPLVGDVDGDGKADPIAWRLSTGTWYWLAAIGGQKQWGL